MVGVAALGVSNLTIPISPVIFLEFEFEACIDEHIYTYYIYID